MLKAGILEIEREFFESGDSILTFDRKTSVLTLRFEAWAPIECFFGGAESRISSTLTI